MLDIEDLKMASSTNTQADEVAKFMAIVEHMMRARDNDASLDKANLVEETLQISSLYTK